MTMASMTAFATRLLIGLPCLLLAVAVQGGTLNLEGEPVQGALIIGRTDPGTTVKFNGNAVRVSNRGVFLLGFGRDAPEKAHLDATFADGTSVAGHQRGGPTTNKVHRNDRRTPSTG